MNFSFCQIANPPREDFLFVKEKKLTETSKEYQFEIFYQVTSTSPSPHEDFFLLRISLWVREKLIALCKPPPLWGFFPGKDLLFKREKIMAVLGSCREFFSVSKRKFLGGGFGGLEGRERQVNQRIFSSWGFPFWQREKLMAVLGSFQEFYSSSKRRSSRGEKLYLAFKNEYD